MYEGEDAVNTILRQSQSEVLSRLYEMKCKQIKHAREKGEHLHSQVLEAEAEAISNALKSVR